MEKENNGGDKTNADVRLDLGFIRSNDPRCHPLRNRLLHLQVQVDIRRSISTGKKSKVDSRSGCYITSLSLRRYLHSFSCGSCLSILFLPYSGHYWFDVLFIGPLRPCPFLYLCSSRFSFDGWFCMISLLLLSSCLTTFCLRYCYYCCIHMILVDAIYRVFHCYLHHSFGPLTELQPTPGALIAISLEASCGSTQSQSRDL